MRTHLGAALLATLFGVPSFLAAQVPGDAYLDEAAAVMVAGARIQSDSATSQITAYEATHRERTSVGLEASHRDRLLYRQEIASRITWSREAGRRTEVLGARETAPLISREVTPLTDQALARGLGIGFDPTGGWLLRLPGTVADDSTVTNRRGSASAQVGVSDSTRSVNVGVRFEIVHPLAPGSETDYRFRSGETTSIRLADGRTLRIVELHVLPRRAAPELLSGSFWLDAETHAPVRGVFSMASPARFSPAIGFIPLPVPDAAITLRYLTVEYGLWENRWWLGRLVAYEGSFEFGPVSVPVSIEATYGDYRIYTADTPWPGFEAVDTTQFRLVEERCREDTDDCPERLVLVPQDTSVLVQSPEFPRSIYSRAGRLITERELDEIAGFVDAVRWRGMIGRIPDVRWDPLAGSLLRYNRVEGLTLGTRLDIGLPPLASSAALWIGTADLSPSFEVELGRTRVRGSEAVSVYRRLEAFSPRDRPFALGNSFSAFAFGRDDGDYYRALGAGIALDQSPGMGTSLRLRAYAERQDGIEKGTDVSIPHWTRDRVFRDNPAADEADQLGFEAGARLSRGLDPVGFRGRLDLNLLAETGDFRFARPSAEAFVTFPLPASLLGATQLGAGTSFGDLPLQRLWYLGGRGSVRGIDAEDRLRGEAFWAGRAEIGTDRPGARLVLFGDAGWTGDRNAFTTDPSLISAGVGISFFDGLIRADLARVVRGPRRWSFQLSVDAGL
jgi:hypothetical protein